MARFKIVRSDDKYRLYEKVKVGWFRSEWELVGTSYSRPALRLTIADLIRAERDKEAVYFDSYGQEKGIGW